MIYYSGILLMAIIISLLETTVVQSIEIFGLKPDLYLITVIYYSLFTTRLKATAIGFFLGLLQDSLSYGLFGLNALTKSAISYIIATMREDFLGENLIVDYILAFSATLINGFIIGFLALPFVTGEEGLWSKVLLLGIYNSLLLPPTFYFINKGEKLLTLYTSKYSKA